MLNFTAWERFLSKNTVRSSQKQLGGAIFKREAVFSL